MRDLGGFRMLAVTCTSCPNNKKTQITIEVCGDGSILLECLNCGDLKRIPRDVESESAE